MNVGDIAFRRLRNQHLWGNPLPTPERVVASMAAIQAQEFAYARWSVAQRSSDESAQAVDRAFAAGAILRTHVMRPTWHFVAADDIRWILQVSAPRVHARNAHYYRQQGVDVALTTKSNRLFAKALEGGRQLTRTEMAEALKRGGISAEGVRLAYVLMHAELDGIICSGALRGRQHTYALLDERAPKAKAMHRDDALAQLTRRYFVSRGPATVKDYATWSSLTVTEAKRGLEMVKEHLEVETIDSRTYWFAPTPAMRPPRLPIVDLLQGYDEYVMSYSESRDLMFMRGGGLSRPLDRESYYHAVLLDGQLIGHWRHRLDKRAAFVETQLGKLLNTSEMRAFEVAVRRYGDFLGVPTDAKESRALTTNS